MTAPIYRCGHPVDPQDPTPTCPHDGQPLEPRVFGEGYLDLNPTGEVGYETSMGYTVWKSPSILLPTNRSVKVRLVEVIEP